ncbi:CBS domain-containing protein, partial [bacterium]|nr:CBS domain-containing protein [bacterium]
IKMMQTHKISGLAIVDSQGKILGSYSEWDAMIQGSSHDLTDSIKYKTPPISVTEDTVFRFVVAQLIKTKVKRLFITDKQNYLVGIITRSDVLKHIFDDFLKEEDSE